MPVLKRRYQHMKIYRPNGTRFANGDTKATVEEAIASAYEMYVKEFIDLPLAEQTVIEVFGVTGGWMATLMRVDW